MSKDEDFIEKMRNLFNSKPNGKLILSNLEILIQRIEALEEKMKKIEDVLK